MRSHAERAGVVGVGWHVTMVVLCSMVWGTLDELWNRSCLRRAVHSGVSVKVGAVAMRGHLVLAQW